MDKIDRLSWEASESYVAYGVRFAVRVRGGGLPTLDGHLPPGTRRLSLRTVDRMYSIVAPKEGSRRGVRRFHLLYGDADLLARTIDPTALVTALTDDLQLRVAELAPRRIFVHAGVVGWRGRAIVLPGASFAGKSTQVAALVRAGATYYSDEYAVLDTRGRVWPFARPLSLRTSGDRSDQRITYELGQVPDRPLPVGVVWLTEYAEGTRTRPEKMIPGRAALAMLAHTLTARRQPKAALAALSAVARRATLFTGPRGAAEEAAQWLLEQVRA